MDQLHILMAMLVATALFSQMPFASAESPDAQIERGCPPDDGWTYLSTPEEIVPQDGNQTPGLYGPIAVGWTDPPTIYSAGLRRGLQRSIDCGRTWEAVQPGWSGVRDIALDQLEQIQVVSYQGPLVHSADGGKTWDGARVYYEGDSVGSAAHASDIATSPKIPGEAYGAIRPYGGRRGPVLAQTTDSGVTWHVLADRPPGDLPLVDPVRDLLYVTCGDGSLCQIDLASSEFRLKPFAKLPAAVIAQTINASANRHWIATRDGQIYLSSDRGVTWEPLHDVPTIGLWRHLAASHTDPSAFFAVAEDGGVWMYREPPVKVAPVQAP